MSRWVKAAGIGLACLACCLPLVLGVAGVTTGAAGAVRYWLGRNAALVVAGVGLVYLVIVLIRRLPARQSHRKTKLTERKEPTP